MSHRGHPSPPDECPGRDFDTPTSETGGAATGPRISRSIAVLAAGEIVSKASRFLAAVLMARTLGLDEFGEVNVVVAVVGAIVVLSSLGLPEIGARDVAGSPDTAVRTAGVVIVGRLLAVVVLGTVGLLSVAILFPHYLVPLVLGVWMAAALGASGDWWLRGTERMGATAAATAAGGLIVLAGMAGALAYFPTTEAALCVLAVGETAAALLTWRFAGISPSPRGVLRRLRPTLIRSWPLAISGLVVYSYYLNVDTVLIAAFHGEADAGRYSAPYRVFLSLNVVAIFAAFALLPRSTRAHLRTGEAVPWKKTSRGLLAYGLIVLAAAEAFGGRGLEVLFGPSFAGLEPVIVLLCLAIPWYSVAYPIGYAAIGSDDSRRYLRGAAVAGVIAIALGLILIPPFDIVGAAVATSVSLIAGSVVWIGTAPVSQRPGRYVLAGAAVASVGGLLTSADVIAAGPVAAATLLGALTAARSAAASH